MHSTSLFTIADASYRDELRAKMLGDAIPAESFAAGANEISGFLNHNMQTETPNGWPEQRERKTSTGVIRQWLHSDVKDISFYYVYQLFEKITTEE